MVDSAEMVAEFTLGRTRDGLKSDAMFRLTLTKLIEIIGEAAKQVTQNARGESSDIPWSAVTCMRDRLDRHGKLPTPPRTASRPKRMIRWPCTHREPGVNLDRVGRAMRLIGSGATDKNAMPEMRTR